MAGGPIKARVERLLKQVQDYCDYELSNLASRENGRIPNTVLVRRSYFETVRSNLDNMREHFADLEDESAEEEAVKGYLDCEHILWGLPPLQQWCFLAAIFGFTFRRNRIFTAFFRMAFVTTSYVAFQLLIEKSLSAFLIGLVGIGLILYYLHVWFLQLRSIVSGEA